MDKKYLGFHEHPSTSYKGAEADDWPTLTSTGVFRINLSTLYPSFGSSEGGAQHNEPGNRTIGLYHSHLAIGALVWLVQPLVFGRPY